jgi:hypothetical protein
MGIIEKTRKLKGVNRVIKNKVTGTPKEIAEKIEISRACLYNYIEDLKSAGAEIKYNRSLRCFFYKNKFDFNIIIGQDI